MSIEERVKQNYHKLIEKNVHVHILDFLNKHPSIADRDPFFIKGFCKVGYLLFMEEPKNLGGQVARLLGYHVEGIQKLERMGREHMMRAHLAGYAGYIAWKSATTDEEREEAYRLSTYSAAMAEGKNPHYASMRLLEAAKMAREAIMKQPTSPDAPKWMARKFGAMAHRSELRKSESSRAYDLSEAGYEANSLYKKTREPYWLRQWRETKLESAAHTEWREKRAAFDLASAAEATHTLYELASAAEAAENRRIGAEALILCSLAAEAIRPYKRFWSQNLANRRNELRAQLPDIGEEELIEALPPVIRASYTNSTILR